MVLKMCEDDASKGSYLPGYLPGLCEVHQSIERANQPQSTGVPHLVSNSTDKTNSSTDKTNSSTGKANSSKDQANSSIEKANGSTGMANSSTEKVNNSMDRANNSTDRANNSKERANNSMDRANNSKHKPNNSKDMLNNQTNKTNNSQDNPNSTDKSNNIENEVGNSRETINSKVKTFKSTEKVDNSKVIPFNSTNKLISSSHLLSPIQSELSVKPITSVNSVGSSACRICHTSDRDCLLVSPCMCKGTLAYVHLSCLERWLNQNGRNYCEVCNHRYTISQTPHYGWFQGMRVWLCLPHVRRYVLVDVLTIMLLTTLLAGLITVCLVGVKYYIEEGQKLGITSFWSQAIITFFLSVMVLTYCVIVYLMFKEKVVHWRRWWRQNVEIRLVLDHMPPTVTQFRGR